MRAISVLPDNYKEFLVIDLQKDKKLMLLVNAIAVVISAAMVVPAAFAVPISTLFDMEQGLLPYCIRFGSLIGLMAVYMVLHELVHGVAMKICGTKKIKYGFTGMYAFAGSQEYYDKRSYIFIALAPVVLWGVVIAVVNSLVSTQWFWVIYLLQVMNISGAAGDFYVTVRFLPLSKDILVRDHGVGMTVYAKQND